MKFFTFCVFINRITKIELENALYMLVLSMEKNLQVYHLSCFINYSINFERFKEFNVSFYEYYDNKTLSCYNDNWLNMSFNKLNIYKDLYDNTCINHIWIDLDTIIATDISYMNSYSNIFIENGGLSNKNCYLFTNNNTINIPLNKYIQGNFWKINIEIYKELMRLYEDIKSKNLILKYDTQTLFSYYIYYYLKGNLENIYILGNNLKSDTLNGLAIWNKNGNTHATLEGLYNLYLEDNKLKSKFYQNKEIHIVSFTFFTLNEIKKNNYFNQIFNLF
tara:strand:- start:1141 stop:1971 length:831 start_codon:yes stop_codon:yes gene_type:complete